jgi:hypothetical protein
MTSVVSGPPASSAVRDQAHREEVARQVEDVLDGVARAELGEHFVADARQVLGAEPTRAADAHVHGRVLDERRRDHAALHERFDHHVLGLDAVTVEELLAASGHAAQELVADVERRVRPRALRQVFDHLRDALLAVHEDDVALADGGAEARQVVRLQELVLPARAREHARGGVDHSLAEPSHRCLAARA